MLRKIAIALIVLVAVSGVPGAGLQSSRAAPGTFAASAMTAVAGIPKFFDLVVDDAHSHLFGSNKAAGTVVVLGLPNLNTVKTIALGPGSSPSGMSLSGDSAQLAVALYGAGQIALIDTSTLTVTGYLQPLVESGPNQPYDVRYGRAGRLYSVGNPQSFGTDYVHAFDTVTRTEVSDVGIGHTPIRSAPRLAITADHNTLYVSESAGSPQQLYRFDITTDTPTKTGQGPHGPVLVWTFAINADASAVYTSAGQVWSGDLQQMSGEFAASGLHIEYVTGGDRLFVSQDLTSTIIEVDPQADYAVKGVWPISGPDGVIRASADGSRLYVSTDAGIDIIRLDLPTIELTPQLVGGEGRVLGGGSYSQGSVATLRAEPLNPYVPFVRSPYIFTGWTVDGKNAGWANPLRLTMDHAHTVVANYASTAHFPDVGGSIEQITPTLELASRGIVRGYLNGNFGPDDRVQRAQMAALIARATPAGPGTPTNGTLIPPACVAAGTWDCEDWGNSFTDRGGIVASLWRDAGTLQHYGVAFGYEGGACEVRGAASPCYGPGDKVTFAQTISFITRAMIAKGYWVAKPNAPLPYQGVPDGHAIDFRTFHFYTGGVPLAESWNGSASRDWFAQALWAALNSYWGADGLLPDGRPAGGYVP